MNSNLFKKILKGRHVKFLLAIVTSILIHLFLFGGVDLYNPFVSKNSDNMNIVIESHLESAYRSKEKVAKKNILSTKESVKQKKEIVNDFSEITDSSIGSVNQSLGNNDLNETSKDTKKKDILYKKVVIDYEVRRSIDGSALGAAKTTYSLEENNRYSIRNEVEAKGFASLFYWNKLLQTSDGLVTGDGLKPINYHYQFGGKIDNFATFDWESKKMITSINGKLNEFEMFEGSQDMLSFMYQFMFEPPLIKMKIYITNGKNYKPYDYAYIGEEIIETGAEKLLTMHIAKFNYNNEERIDLWLSKDYRYLPVKIRKTEKDGSILDQSANKIETESLGP